MNHARRAKAADRKYRRADSSARAPAAQNSIAIRTMPVSMADGRRANIKLIPSLPFNILRMVSTPSDRTFMPEFL
jgi:hypothetical protein